VIPSRWTSVLRRGSRPAPVAVDANSRLQRVPRHLAIIMDGNGRWARQRRLPVAAGHRAGTQAVRRVVEAARDLGIRQLTLYSFSTENWSRSDDEVEGLMRLHAEMIDGEVPKLHENGCRVLFIGRRDRMDERLLQKIIWAETLTAKNQRMTLFIAFDYGGRHEIVEAVRRVLEAGVMPGQLTEDTIHEHLYAPGMVDPDLIIRTSGERRLSNFLLWQSAYSELYFSDRLWPDFSRADLLEAIADYGRRERRFGGRNDESRGGSSSAGVATEHAGAASDA
jgi:undecaprenyl diphosphate synthase